MSTHNIRFYGEITKNTQIPSLSVPLIILDVLAICSHFCFEKKNNSGKGAILK